MPDYHLKQVHHKKHGLQYQYFMLKNLISRGVLRYFFCAETNAIQAPRRFSQTITKARPVMNLYKLQPKSTGELFVAPNATIVGEVYLGSRIWVGHGTVIRGDINSVYIHQNVVIGDNCVLHTAPCLPSGLPAQLSINTSVVVSAGCTLYSCTIQKQAFIGANTVILEGARIQEGAVILPNSVVPPGRVVPANQVWGGNPIKFVRFAKEQQKFITKKYSETAYDVSQLYKQQFLPYNNAYLYKPSNPEEDRIKARHLVNITEFIEDESRGDQGNPTI